ncbi:MAG TPA: MFS transporter [Gaiellaceae bacterium]|nr:MFS transporter [Gaiellaceae bacterium]
MPGRMPLRARLLYASSSFGGEALTQSRSLFLVYFYSEANDYLSAFTVGLVLTAARLLETVDDGLVGYWSDRTRSRLGRRIPFILLATPFWALFAFLLFTPPASSAAAAAAYLFIVVELYFLASTLSGGPYEALLPEIAPSSDERVSIVGLRVYLGAAGAGLGLVGGFLLVDAVGYAGMAATLALVALSFRYLGLAGAWRYASRTQPPAELGLREALATTFRNRYFLLFLPAFALFQLGFQLLLGVLPFLIEASLEIEEIGRWGAALTAVALGTMLVTIPLLTRLSRRTSKRQAYRLSLLGALALFPLLAFAGFLPGVPEEAQLVGAMVLVGLPIAGNYLFPAPLTADIIDHDALRTGMRREATYYGAQNFVEKTTSALAPLVLGALLALGSDADDPLGIRLAGPAAALLVLGGWLAFRRYDLPDDVLEAARAEPPVAPSASASAEAT